MSTPITVTQLIQRSGNNFHAKVARWFKSNDWHTTVSPYYMDQTQGKARELDLVVEKLWPIRSSLNQHEGYIVIRLFVECKFVASESVFWFASKNSEAAQTLVCSLGAYRQNSTHTSKHHYIAESPRVAKLFTSSNSKTQETEPFYKALNQALNGTVAMKSKSPSHPALTDIRGKKVIVFNYPVVICSSFAQLYNVDFLAESQPTVIQENFQLEVQYAFHDRAGNQRDDYFLLDFVEFDQLTKFEEVIDEGAKAGAYLASS
jgi:hypothetical protein